MKFSEILRAKKFRRAKEMSLMIYGSPDLSIRGGFYHSYGGFIKKVTCAVDEEGMYWWFLHDHIDLTGEGFKPVHLTGLSFPHPQDFG